MLQEGNPEVSETTQLIRPLFILAWENKLNFSDVTLPSLECKLKSVCKFLASNWKGPMNSKFTNSMGYILILIDQNIKAPQRNEPACTLVPASKLLNQSSEVDITDTFSWYRSAPHLGTVETT